LYAIRVIVDRPKKFVLLEIFFGESKPAYPAVDRKKILPYTRNKIFFVSISLKRVFI